MTARPSTTAPGSPPPPQGGLPVARRPEPITRAQFARVGLLLIAAFIAGALLLRLQADRIRTLDMPLPTGWSAVSADSVLAGVSPQSAVRAARAADAPVGATPHVRLIRLNSAGSDAAGLVGVYWLIVTDDIRPTMSVPVGDSLDIIRAYVLVGQDGKVALAVERGFSSASPTLPPD